MGASPPRLNRSVRKNSGSTRQWVKGFVGRWVQHGGRSQRRWVVRDGVLSLRSGWGGRACRDQSRWGADLENEIGLQPGALVSVGLSCMLSGPGETRRRRVAATGRTDDAGGGLASRPEWAPRMKGRPGGNGPGDVMKRGVKRLMAAPVTIEHSHLSNYPMKLTACGTSALNSCPRSHAAAYGGR